MMFIETAVKNIALEEILIDAKSESIQVMYDKVVSSYRNAPSNATVDDKQKLQKKKRHRHFLWVDQVLPLPFFVHCPALSAWSS